MSHVETRTEADDIEAEEASKAAGPSCDNAADESEGVEEMDEADLEEEQGDEDDDE